MIKGIGIDIIELSRIEEISNQQQKFIDRILTPLEKEKLEVLTGRRRIEFIAGRFAAKEAFSKANGTGIGKELSFHDIETDNDPSGKPMIVKPKIKAHLSISHSKEYAVAQVIIEEK